MEFPDTRWTLIAHLHDPAQALTALDQLCAVYWGPVYAYLRRAGRNHAEAQDLTQDFLRMVVRQRLLERANPVSGRLRSWLLSSLQNFLANARRYETRQKRGAGVDVLPLDHGGVLPELEGIAAQGLSAAEAFDRAWVTVLLRRVLELLTLQYERAGKDKELAALLPWLMEEGAVSQAQDAARAGMTPASFRVQLHRLRARYKETLRQEIVATLEREEDYEEELNYLFRLAGQQG